MTNLLKTGLFLRTKILIIGPTTLENAYYLDKTFTTLELDLALVDAA